MTDAGSTIPGASPSKRMADGLDSPFDARLAEKVSVEADRVSGTIAGGIEAVKGASQTYGHLVTDGYARMIRSSMRSGAEFSDHLATLMRAKTPLELFALNSAFFRKQVSAMPSRVMEMMGMSVGVEPVAGPRP